MIAVLQVMIALLLVGIVTLWRAWWKLSRPDPWVEGWRRELVRRAMEEGWKNEDDREPR